MTQHIERRIGLRLLQASLVVAALTLSVTATAPALADSAPVDEWSLPLHDTHELLVDSARHRVLISGDNSLLAVAPATGNTLARIDGLPGATALLRTNDPDVVWVAVQGSFVELSLATLATTRTVALPPGWCADEAVWSLNRIWVSDSCGSLGLVSFRPGQATPTATLDDPDLNIGSLVAATDGSAVYIVSGPDAGRYVLSSGHLVQTAQMPVLNSFGPAGLSATADPHTLLATWGSEGRYVDAATLEVGATVPVWGQWCVPSPDGGLFAATGNINSRIWSSTGELRTNVVTARMDRRGLAWLDNDTVAAVSDNPGQDATLTVQKDSGRRPTELELNVLMPYGPLRLDQSIQLSGRLLSTDGAAIYSHRMITMSRAVGGSTSDLGTATTSSDGSFTFLDPLPLTASAVKPVYTATFAGDSSTRPAEGTARAELQAADWDFNGDGFQDTAIGAPLKDVGGAKNAGSVTVIYGSSAGTSPTGAQTWTQNSIGVPGSAETSDQFGFATTSGDYNTDGFADLAVGTNNETVGHFAHAGIVTVIYGSAAGLTGTGSRNLAPSKSVADGFFGEALATEHAPHGWNLLLVGMPGASTVVPFIGDTWTRGATYSEDNHGVPGKSNQGEAFGASIAVGDFNGDQMEDVAIGNPNDYDDHGYSSGSVVIVYGNKGTQPRPQRFSLETSGIAGAPHLFTPHNHYDQFGNVLSAGDLNGDGADDLAIGVPGADTPGTTHDIIDGGQVTVLYGGPTGLRRSVRLTQQTPGIVGLANARDAFGTAVAIDKDRPGADATLFVGESTIEAVHVLPGGEGIGSTRITQESPGVPGGTEAEDAFGWFLRPVHSRGFELPADLFIGAPGENGAGSVVIAPGGDTGVTGLGAVLWTQETNGIPGSSRAGDYWGWLGDSR